MKKKNRSPKPGEPTWLENLLRQWEDFWFLHQVMSRAVTDAGLKVRGWEDSVLYDMYGPMLHSSEFRQYLLEKTSFDAEEVKDLFCYPDPVVCPALESSALPMAAWCKTSRRIYRLSESVQALLDATSVDGLHLEKVEWPFPCFAISLARPLVSPQNILYQDILVWVQKREKETEFVIHVFEDKIRCYRPLTIDQRQRMLTLHKQKRYVDVVKGGYSLALEKGIQYVTMDPLIVRHGVAIGEVRNAVKDHDPIALGEESAEGVKSIDDAALRFIIGLPMYLRSCPSVASASSLTQVHGAGRNSDLIMTEKAEIFHVQGVSVLSRHEIEAFSGPLGQPTMSLREREVKCHFRSGYWRRPWGQGSDPAAEKTVRVPPVIVRADKYESGCLPAGAEQFLK